MSSISIGDLAQSLKLRQDNIRLRSDLERLSQELSTGRKSDVTAAVSGDFGALSGLENSLSRLSSFDLAVKETGLMVSTTQAVLGQVQTNMAELSGALLLATESVQPAFISNVASDARVRMDSVISALNTRVGDRSVFAGAATDGVALADADTMLADINLLIAAETTAAGVEAVIDTYFAPAGGFETTGYLGSVQPMSSVAVSDTERVEFPASANDTEIRETLAAFAKAAILDEGGLSGFTEERAILARRAGESMLNANSGLLDMQTATGAREAQIDRATVKNAAEQASIELAISELVSVDPFAVAAELQAVEIQLEAFYTLTARMANLSLTGFLR